jgi:hypothetical protein
MGGPDSRGNYTRYWRGEKDNHEKHEEPPKKDEK